MATASSQGARFDSPAYDEQRKLIESPAFRRIWSRIEADHTRAVTGCTREDGEIQLRRAQGAAAALATVLALPEQILAEMRAGKR